MSVTILEEPDGERRYLVYDDCQFVAMFQYEADAHLFVDAKRGFPVGSFPWPPEPVVATTIRVSVVGLANDPCWDLDALARAGVIDTPEVVEAGR